jgi:hypothetical protein
MRSASINPLAPRAACLGCTDIYNAVHYLLIFAILIGLSQNREQGISRFQRSLFLT